MWRLFHREPQDGYGDERGDHRNPEHHADVLNEDRGEPDRQQRAGEGAYGIERLTQPEGGATLLLRGEVRHHRVTRRTSQTFSDTVDESRGEDGTDRGRKRK